MRFQQLLECRPPLPASRFAQAERLRKTHSYLRVLDVALAIRRRSVSLSHGQVFPPDEGRLRLRVFVPPAEPRLNIVRPSGMHLERGHRPGVDESAGQGRAERRRGRCASQCFVMHALEFQTIDPTRAGVSLQQGNRGHELSKAVCFRAAIFAGGTTTSMRSFLAPTVDAAESLDHALPFDEIAHHIVGIEVHTDFTRRGRDKECGWRDGVGGRASSALIAGEAVCASQLKRASRSITRRSPTRSSDRGSFAN